MDEGESGHVEALPTAGSGRAARGVGERARGELERPEAELRAPAMEEARHPRLLPCRVLLEVGVLVGKCQASGEQRGPALRSLLCRAENPVVSLMGTGGSQTPKRTFLSDTLSAHRCVKGSGELT